jgi:hypothetical protein
MNYDTWKLDSPDESIPQDYKSDRYISLERMLNQSQQREQELKNWYNKVSGIKRAEIKAEYEHEIDICYRSQNRIELAMTNEEDNY